MAWDLSNKEERTTLMKQLGSEYREKCLRQKSPRDCHYLAHFLETVNKDVAKAATLFRKTCDDHQYGDSCQKFAHLVRRGIEGIDPSVSVDYDRKGCDYGQAKSCFHAAMAIVSDTERGQVPSKNLEPNDPLEAVNLLDRACDLGCDNSCYLAGGLYLVGVPGILEKDVSVTYRYDLKACQLGNQLACANLRGALPVECPGHDNPISNGFVIRRLQLKIRNERLRREYSNSL
ncbi:hypothetical protein GHT06_016399 [Daphnia sinensis]|uniref:Uncharacterized protein n=1 Tax=Daphnia sinensis TaxID=1820382 RepID=A0AAD5KNI1_9CRUS|nr:hypothetical protein GHT06_016399 [Daphnia sinensis]